MLGLGPHFLLAFETVKVNLAFGAWASGEYIFDGINGIVKYQKINKKIKVMTFFQYNEIKIT